MIVVWNCERGQAYGFADIEAYKKFAVERENAANMCWSDEVHDVGDGGECTPENEIDLGRFNALVSDGHIEQALSA